MQAQTWEIIASAVDLLKVALGDGSPSTCAWWCQLPEQLPWYHFFGFFLWDWLGFLFDVGILRTTASHRHTTTTVRAQPHACGGASMQALWLKISKLLRMRWCSLFGYPAYGVSRCCLLVWSHRYQALDFWPSCCVLSSPKYHQKIHDCCAWYRFSRYPDRAESGLIRNCCLSLRQISNPWSHCLRGEWMGESSEKQLLCFLMMRKHAIVCS